MNNYKLNKESKTGNYDNFILDNPVLTFCLISSIVTVVSLAAFHSPKAKCNIKEKHAHLYEGESGINGYLISEEINNRAFKNSTRKDDYKIINTTTSYYDELSRIGLVEIESNKDKLLEYQKNNMQDKIEYQYKNKHYFLHERENKPSILLPFSTRKWTTDENHKNKTGLVRLVHKKLVAYKPVYINEGYYSFESDSFERLEEIPEEYKYIKADALTKDEIYKTKITEMDKFNPIIAITEERSNATTLTKKEV